MIKKYNKLVRDRIPEIIASNGHECKTKILADAEYLTMLDAKLNEEIAEYQQDKNIEELADMLEVIRAITAARGYTWAYLFSQGRGSIACLGIHICSTGFRCGRCKH